MKKDNHGFTMIELLIVILIIGFLLSASMYIFNSTRMKSRDAQRAANISTITKSLSLYINEVFTFPPAPNGICLNGMSQPAKDLISKRAIAFMPYDPLWASTSPASFVGPGNNYPAAGQTNFCYWYWTNANSSQYYLSYFLETNSSAGTAGINKVSQIGN
jgi:prepilin-type N-terminal cleavage/methylation domain-containing protein